MFHDSTGVHAGCGGCGVLSDGAGLVDGALLSMAMGKQGQVEDASPFVSLGVKSAEVVYEV